MSMRTSSTLPVWLLAVPALAAIALGFAGYSLLRQERQLQQMERQLEQVFGELTRIRLEQRAEQKGPAGLLEKLRAYAPILVSGRTTAPDYESAKKEMDAILRAFETIGPDAWPFVRGRIAELKPEKNFDELKWLLEAAVRCDRKPGIDLAAQVLQGTLLPSARLRWHAADMLLRHEPQLAQRLLRQILLTESSRGIDVERASVYGAPIPDQAAFSTTGFHNFVVHYIRSGDEKIEETLLMLLGRTEHDLITLQECIEELGRRACARAVEPIKKLYANPPGRVENPLFLNKCLEAIVAIEGDKARPFLEEAQRSASHEMVQKRIQELLLK